MRYQNGSEKNQKPPYPESLSTRITKEFNPGPQSHSYGKTLRDTAMMIGLGLGTVFIAEHLGIHTGNAAETPSTIAGWMQNPLQAVLTTSLEGPAGEEYAFRLGPSFILNSINSERRGKTLWTAGIITSALFASLHNLAPGSNGGMEFHTDILPLYQFISGLFLWKMARERGIQHSYIAHGLNNAIALGLLEVGFKM